MIRNAYASARLAAVASAALLVAALMPAAHAQQPATSEATAAAAITSDATAGTMIPQGTPVFVTLKQRLQSGTARRGETVTFAVTSDVRRGGAAAGPNTEVLIPAGTPAFGTVAESRRAGRFGKPGTLRLTCDYAVLDGGRRVSLRPASPLEARGRSRRSAGVLSGVVVGVGVGYVTLVAVALDNLFSSNGSSSSPLPLITGVGSGILVSSLWRGGNVTLPEGKTFAVEVAAPVAAPAPIAPAVGTDGRRTDQP
jgi:hypothetical protein